GYKIKVEDFDLNFEFEDGPLISERFPGRNNAAVELSLYKDEKLLKRGWFFWAFPEFQEFKDLGLLVRFDNYWQPEIKDYKSELSIIENGKTVLTKTIEINHPLKYKGIMFYQNTYREPIDKDLSVYVSGLQVVKDPGVWIVYFGCGLMIIGVILSFYIYHERIWMNIGSEKDNKILIGGISNKNHLIFDIKFKKILNQIRNC
ncbi:cytochrome c biogenesis protein ResB, partial [Candidatus Desantisbacteria bacterium]|nr:cytochrome c biogenesis protein ResB [Candidatus Desantisbacteria bacterium]